MTTDPQTRPPDPPPSSGVLRFALTAGAWFIGLFGLMRLGWVERQILLPFAQLQADQLTGVQTDAVYVDASCSGGDAMALCLGAVLAFPAPWSARLRGAGGGLLVIGCPTNRDHLRNLSKRYSMNTPLTQRNSSHHVHAKTGGRVRVRSLAARGLAVVLIALAARLALPLQTDPTPTVTISADKTSAVFKEDDITYTLTRTGSTTAALPVTVLLSTPLRP